MLLVISSVAYGGWSLERSSTKLINVPLVETNGAVHQVAVRTRAADRSKEHPTRATRSADRSRLPRLSKKWQKKKHWFKDEARRTKPAQAEHVVWQFLEVYAKVALAGTTICLLCEQDGNYGSPTNLLAHLARQKAAHCEALEKVLKGTSKGGQADRRAK